MRSVLAVAGNTIKQAVRMKIAAVFVILLLILLPVMALAMTGDGTLKGRVQSFINYGFSLIVLLLSVLTIVASIYSVTSDLKEKQVFTVLTKPIRRFQLLAGKLIGIIVLDIVLLFIFSAIIYGITIAMVRTASDPLDVLRLKNEFLTARQRITPNPPNVEAQVTEQYNKLQKDDQLSQLYPGYTRERIINDLTNKKKQSQWTAPPGNEIVWTFDNVKLSDPREDLFIRFKYEVLKNPIDLQVTGTWSIGDNRKEKSPTPIRNYRRKDLIRTEYEIPVPADVVASDGYVAVRFFNDPRVNDTAAIFPLEDGIQLLYKAGTFTGNFIRVVFFVLFRLIFLACLGILASTFLSFPVAILLCFMVLGCGLMSGFIIESFTHLGDGLSKIYHYSILPIVHMLPKFDKTSPASFMVAGKFLSWPVFFKTLAIMVGIKSVLLFLLAIAIFASKEIARVIV